MGMGYLQPNYGNPDTLAGDYLLNSQGYRFGKSEIVSQRLSGISNI